MRALLIALALVLCAAPVRADTLNAVALRARIEANGPAITLGDVFDGAGAAASRPIAPAPPPGQIARLQPEFLVAAAQSAGLEWTPPQNQSAVLVVRPGGARATVAAPSAAPATVTPVSAHAPSATSEIVVHRGDLLTVAYTLPGLAISARARACSDGGVGDTISIAISQSCDRGRANQQNRIVDVIVTGPGAAVSPN